MSQESGVYIYVCYAGNLKGEILSWLERSQEPGKGSRAQDGTAKPSFTLPAHVPLMRSSQVKGQSLWRGFSPSSGKLWSRGACALHGILPSYLSVSFLPLGTKVKQAFYFFLVLLFNVAFPSVGHCLFCIVCIKPSYRFCVLITVSFGDTLTRLESMPFWRCRLLGGCTWPSCRHSPRWGGGQSLIFGCMRMGEHPRLLLRCMHLSQLHSAWTAQNWQLPSWVGLRWPPGWWKLAGRSGVHCGYWSVQDEG